MKYVMLLKPNFSKQTGI